jgi:ubiquinone/menaquinone biosynthesis C-methylase UbiE
MGSEFICKQIVECKKINGKIKTVQDDAQKLTSIPDDYFDLVVSTQVIEHVDDDGAMLKSLHRFCKKGGIIYLDTVFKKPYARYFHKNQYNKWALDPTHEREYMNDQVLFPTIKETGLKIIYSKK